MDTTNERGLSKITVVVFGGLLGAVLYTAYHVLPFYYYYYELQNHMLSLSRVASTHTDAEIRSKLMYHIKRMEIPVSADEIRISREGQRIRMRVRYEEVFYISFRGEDYDLRTFPFDAYIDEEF